MKIYPASIILIFILLFTLLADWKKGLQQYFKHVFFIYVAVVMFSNIGYFIQIGSFSLTHRAFLSVFTFFVSLAVIIFDQKFDRKILLAGGCLCVCVLLGYISLSLFPYTYGIIHDISQWDNYVAGIQSMDYNPKFVFDFETVFKIIHFPVVLSVAYKVFFDSLSKEKLLKSLLNISNYVLIYCFIELIAIKVFSFPISKYICIPIFGESEATFIYTDRLQGLFKEASHYAGALFIWGMLNIFQMRLLRKQESKAPNNLWGVCLFRFILICVLMLGSTSFVGILYLFLLLLAFALWATTLKASVVFCYSGCLVLLGILVLSSESIMTMIGLEDLYQRVERMMVSLSLLIKGEMGLISSEGARFTSIFSMFKILSRRPLLGVGAGITDAHSTLFATLGNLGLIGTAILGYIYIRYGKVSNYRKSFYCIVLLYLAFAGSFGGIFDFQYPMLFFFAGYALQKKFIESEERQEISNLPSIKKRYKMA